MANPTQQDSDHDGTGDACEDKDHDAVDNDVDNCEDDYNPGQEDADGDFIGDACEPDNDNDGVIDDNDNCQFVPGGGTDTDGDGLGDVCDPCPNGADLVIAWSAGVHQGSINIPPHPILADSDGDGTPDGCDASPTGFKINGRWADAMTSLSTGVHATLEGATTPAAPIGVAIDPCHHRDCRAYSALVPVWVKVTGLPAGAVDAAIIDDRGRVQAHRTGDGTLQFAPRGGRVYQLQLRTRSGRALTLKAGIDVGGGER
ncbi:MAG TPA: thrombospondin type 3 repeat-containing protein [Kofleriaceae bacterium]|nr:thrombospondin type 3 repeat-containing protein [Kofleriaceae bacterium]